MIPFERKINARAGYRILADIVHQVVENTPHVTAVGHDPEVLFGLFYHERQVCFRELVIILAGGLRQENARVTGCQMYFEIACGGLRRLHQILDQALQFFRLACKDFAVFRMFFIVAMLLRDQSGVIYDRGQRSLDVMRYVRDQLGLHPLALCTLLHRDAHALSDRVQVFAGPAHPGHHARGVDLILKITARNGLRAFFQHLASCGEIDRESQNKQALYGQEKYRGGRFLCRDSQQSKVHEEINCQEYQRAPGCRYTLYSLPDGSQYKHDRRFPDNAVFLKTRREAHAITHEQSEH